MTVFGACMDVTMPSPTQEGVVLETRLDDVPDDAAEGIPDATAKALTRIVKNITKEIFGAIVIKLLAS
jgi:hypothetical protein